MGWKPPGLPPKGTDAYDRYIESMVRRSFDQSVRGCRLTKVEAVAVSDDPLCEGFGMLTVEWEPIDGRPPCNVLGSWLRPFENTMRMIGDPLFHDGGERGSYIVAFNGSRPATPNTKRPADEA